MINGNEMKAFYRIFFPKRPDEGGLAARLPDANETRLNDNFKTIGDEFRKIWEFIKSANTEGDVSSSFSSSKGGFNAYRCGKMVTVTFLGNSTTWTTDEVVGTIGSDVIPALSYIDVVGYIGRQAVVVRLNQTGDITLWIGSTLTGNQRLYFSCTYPIL